MTLTCSFGLPWIRQITQPCLWCEAEGERLIALFDAAVARGEYDADGYTQSDRQRQRNAQRECAA